MRCLRTMMLTICLACVIYSGDVQGQGSDQPAPAQGVGEHSTICLSDGTSIRDDQLADFIGRTIQNNVDLGGNAPSDVKIMVNSCYGGGILDDIQNIFGPGSPYPACQGIPWVGVSAASANEVAWGWPDGAAAGDPNDPAASHFGSTLTDALGGTSISPPGSGTSNPNPGSIRTGGSGDNVMGDFNAAVNSEDSGPGGDSSEHPVVASGNGGHAINWNSSSSHSAVVFGGSQTDNRHHNNVNNMADALGNLWSGTSPYIDTLDGGTQAQLESAIDAALSLMDGDEQFVLYIDDHGDTEFDFVEWWDHYFGDLWLDPFTGWRSDAPTPDGEQPELHPGWDQGLSGNHAQGETVSPGVAITAELDPFEPFPAESFFDVLYDDMTIGQFYPGVDNDIIIDIPYDPAAPSFDPGTHLLELRPGGTGPLPGTPPILITQLQLTSGPINELEKSLSSDPNAIPEPGTMLLALFGLLGLAGWRWRRRRGR